ncbi:MAG TPA: hypothetical protein VJM32_05570 [Candidatus Saccharimonadales bacterium]|nr:hypothetical protein [Candidatus Saccharimonadales bacterium]
MTIRHPLTLSVNLFILAVGIWVFGESAKTLPADTDYTGVVLGIALMFFGAGMACIVLRNYDGPGTITKGQWWRVAAYCAMVQIGLSILGVTTPLATWSVPAIIVANIGFPVCYVSVTIFAMRLHQRSDDAPAFNWGDAAWLSVFCAGLGILASASLV